MMQEFDRETLAQLARQRQPAVQDLLGQGWEMVVRAAGYGMLNVVGLQEALGSLRRGQSYGSGEITFEPRGNELQVSFFNETVHCPLGPMVEELQRLREACAQQEQGKAAAGRTTEQVVAAIQAAPYRAQALPLEAVLSLPVPALEGGRALLAFFWYSAGGPVQNRTVSTPYCRTLADPDSLEAAQGIRFQMVEPRALGIDLPGTGAFGKPTIGGSVPAAEMKQVRADFYRATDGALALYARSALAPHALPGEDERQELAAYRAAFHRLAVVALLPAYQALSPHFFAWLAAVPEPRAEA